MKYISLILFFILECEISVCCQNSRSIRSEQLYSQISSIRKVPSDEVGDSIYWAIVKGGLDNVPFLIELLDNSQMTDIHAPYFGRDYTIGDLAFIIITDIIFDINIYVLLENAGCKLNKSIGFGNYWEYLEGNDANRIRFKNSVNEWYTINRDNLIWFKTDMHAYSDLNELTPFKNPAGGYYILKKK